jgi:hypothetical protein
MTATTAVAELRFAQTLGELLNMPLVACPPKPGEEFHYPKGDRDNLTTDDNQNQLDKWSPGWAIMARTGGSVAVVDVDPRNGGNIEKTGQLLNGLGVRVFAEIATPSSGLHFYIAGHPELPSTSNLNGWPGIDVLSFGKLVFLPGTQRPKYNGAGYRIIHDNLEALADGGDPDGAEAFADWVAERRGDREQFTASPPWTGGEPDTRQAAYLAKTLAGVHHDLSPLGKDSGRNTAVYNKAMRCGNYIAGAGLNEAVAIDVLLDASRQNGLVQEDGERSLLASMRSGIKNGKARPRAVPEPREQVEVLAPPEASPNGSAPPTDWEEDLWAARPGLTHILNFARARRVGPWALLGCVLVRAIGSVTPDLTLPPLVGSAASLNTFLGIVSMSGGGKGAAESAALEAVDLARIPTYGPGSGEAIGHLFFVWDKKAEELRQHTVSAILSAPEIDTLTALKTRQASTLFPELRKAWMGEPLGFAYVDREKRLTIPRHSYRLGLITGIQPGNAAPILEDHSSGTPQRFLWLPADDPGAPDERPDDPGTYPNPLGTSNDRSRRQMRVCETARAEIDAARVGHLRGNTTDALDGHALLARLKVAAGLAVLDGRTDAITEEDWQLAGLVHAISDRTRQRVIDTLEQAKARTNRARAESEAHRTIVIHDRMAEHTTQRVGRTIMRKLDKIGDWVTHSKLRTSLDSKDRGYFEDAIDALRIARQVEERDLEAEHSGHTGTEYRRAR